MINGFNYFLTHIHCDIYYRILADSSKGSLSFSMVYWYKIVLKVQRDIPKTQTKMWEYMYDHLSYWDIIHIMMCPKVVNSNICPKLEVNWNLGKTIEVYVLKHFPSFLLVIIFRLVEGL